MSSFFSSLTLCVAWEDPVSCLCSFRNQCLCKESAVTSKLGLPDQFFSPIAAGACVLLYNLLLRLKGTEPPFLVFLGQTAKEMRC